MAAAREAAVAAGKEWMNFTIGGIHIDEKNLYPSPVSERCGSDPGSESRAPEPFAEAGNAYQLWFMGNSM